ncbi:cytochrome c553 [Rhodopseudomonas thermotolerans]|uniref:Cytochrome c553 n=2 Tax=Rhodopseudomonas TaxID=1073 RepID=A0A336JJI5_9BRAD|nr:MULTISPECIES: c-type cytochrome [Rhodopseudomonas]RED38427.1 cytochrome c553 [Rhodopseudomonas pentothenatexigens]REG06012.1 cytochrome c553 [Rhodopseudomonas thermotolerans]SSW89880.1 cytochrome c553 [Rhodopseudomonas pentothenatexigens]
MTRLLAALSFCFSLFASPLVAGDIQAGKARAGVCSFCHGADGVSKMEYTPSLAGQPDLYIQWQLVFFRAGTRENANMKTIVEELTNEDIRNLGAYYASLPPMKNPKPDEKPELSRKGAEAAVGRRCASCHTDNFAGTKATARLAGQREEYLIKALNEYKSGQRSGGAMAAMTDVAYQLSEEEIYALAHYLAHLN